MRNWLPAVATIFVVIGLMILAFMMFLRDNDAEPSAETADPTRAESLSTKVSSKVRSIYPQRGFVTLEEIGHLGLAEKSALEVVRDGHVVARLRVTAVEGEVAAADIVPDSVTDGEEVRVGDAVVPGRAVDIDTRVQAADRIATGRVAQGGINAKWGYVLIEDLQGSPQQGDEAYLQRLGPAGGLMTITSVEPNQAFLEPETLALQDLRPGDRIETRPPSIAKED